MRKIVFLGLFLLLMNVAAAAASPPTAAMGLAYSNLVWKDAAARTRIFDEATALHVSWFRDGFRENPTDFVDVLRRAKQKNLKMLVVITQEPGDYEAADKIPDNQGELFGKLCGYPTGSLKLSRINLGKFVERLHAHLEAVKSAGLNIEAFEIGNEVDWVCFNGDIPFGHQATSADIANAAHGYGEFLKAAISVIHNPQYFPKAKIISFGLANINSHWGEAKNNFIDSARFIAALKNDRGVNHLADPAFPIDGFGAHIYTFPGVRKIDDAIDANLEKDRRIFGSSKPIWITEWGFPVVMPTNKTKESRMQAMSHFVESLKARRKNGLWGPAFLYADNGDYRLNDEKGHLLPEARLISEQRLASP